MEQHCDPAQGCQTMTIPHNSNQSNGAMYLPIDPATGVPQGRDAAQMTQADAQLRAKYYRIIEIHQHKGNSECPVGVGIYEQSFDPSCTLEVAKNVCSGLDSDPPEYKQVLTCEPAPSPEFCH